MGEMVGVLWSGGQYSAAILLEEYWNRFMRSHEFKLFCGYPIDIFTDDFVHPQVDAVLGAHSHMVPTSDQTGLRQALIRALGEVVGPNATELEGLIQPARYPHTNLPFAEAAILGIRDNLPEKARAIIAAARLYHQTGKASVF